MERVQLSFTGVQRIFRIAQRAGELDKYEKNTLGHLYDQCSEDEKRFLLRVYGEGFDFLLNRI